MSATWHFRSTGWWRFIDAAFLLVWLAFWLVGELVALLLLVSMLSSSASAALGRPPLLASWAPLTDGSVSLFLLGLLFWITLWTIGGYLAARHLLRSLAGEDSVEATAGELHVRRRTGPFHRRHVIPRSAIHRVRLCLPNRALVVDTDTGTREISDLGTVDERDALRLRLAIELSLPAGAEAAHREMAPRERDIETQGTMTIVTHPPRRARIITTRIVLVLAVLMSLGWIDVLRRGAISAATDGESLSMGLTVLVAAAAMWFALSRTEWLLTPGRIARRRRFAHWTLREQQFERPSTFRVEQRQDSDGDDRYTLVVRNDAGRCALESAVYDEYELLGLGEWLSARTGLPFERYVRQ
jgi:hypothetical protein